VTARRGKSDVVHRDVPAADREIDRLFVHEHVVAIPANADIAPGGLEKDRQPPRSNLHFDAVAGQRVFESRQMEAVGEVDEAHDHVGDVLGGSGKIVYGASELTLEPPSRIRRIDAVQPSVCGSSPPPGELARRERRLVDDRAAARVDQDGGARLLVSSPTRSRRLHDPLGCRPALPRLARRRRVI
jgi:hypothetical protein